MYSKKNSFFYCSTKPVTKAIYVYFLFVGNIARGNCRHCILTWSLSQLINFMRRFDFSCQIFIHLYVNCDYTRFFKWFRCEISAFCWIFFICKSITRIPYNICLPNNNHSTRSNHNFANTIILRTWYLLLFFSHKNDNQTGNYLCGWNKQHHSNLVNRLHFIATQNLFYCFREFEHEYQWASKTKLRLWSMSELRIVTSSSNDKMRNSKNVQYIAQKCIHFSGSFKKWMI